MEGLQILSRLFFSEYKSEVIENFEECCVKLVSSNIITPSHKQITEVLKLFPDRDKILINVTLDDGEPFHFQLDFNTDIAELKTNFETFTEIKDENSLFTMIIKIKKSMDEKKRISIYNFEKLVKYLQNQTLKGIIFCFREALNDNDYIIFELLDTKDNFYSETFYFTGSDGIEALGIDREFRILKRNEICTFLNASECRFVAEDFYLVKKSKSKEFNELMDKLTIIYSLISICNISGFEEMNGLWCRIDGYKSLTNTIKYDEMVVDGASQYYQIYKWMYNEGNLSDKAGLTRNIITIHIKNNNLLELEDNALVSIRSSHEIYLKQNIQQYIDIKNKVVESLDDMAKKVSSMVDSFTGTLKNNFLGIITFFISTVVLNALSGNGAQAIFTKDVSLISYGLLLVSFIFLIASRWEIKQDVKRLKENYKRIKEYYSDILNSGDIEKIFNHDKYHIEDINYVNSKTRFYSIVWVLALVIFYFIIYRSSGISPFK